MDVYQKIGIERIELSANVDVGGYSWARYGFLPTPSAWYTLSQDTLRQRMKYLRMDNDVRKEVEKLLDVSDPVVLWRLADMRTPVAHGLTKENPQPLGKRLLLGQEWRGYFDTTDPAMMSRFNAYVGR
jgi:hypothetical protein